MGLYLKPKKEDKMDKSLKVKKMAGIALFAGLVVVLQLFSNYVTFGPVSITLALIPIVVGAVIYGPIAGFALGCVGGLLVFLAPSTIALFWPYGIFVTFLVCILKMGIAGFVSGLLYKAFNSWNKLFAVIIASIIVPLLNTGLFAVAAYTIYYDLLESFAPEGQSVAVFLFLGFIGFNFIIEFVVNSVLSPVVLRLSSLSKFMKIEEE